MRSTVSLSYERKRELFNQSVRMVRVILYYNFVGCGIGHIKNFKM